MVLDVRVLHSWVFASLLEKACRVGLDLDQKVGFWNYI